MTFNINLSQTATEQLTEAFQYYDERGKGDDFLDEVYRIFDLISENPNLFPIDFDIFRRATVQKFPYLVIYFTDLNDVIVTSVFNTKQNPDKRFPY